MSDRATGRYLAISRVIPDTSKAYMYVAPATTELNHFYLVGSWLLADGEHQTLQSPEGEIPHAIQRQRDESGAGFG